MAFEHDSDSAQVARLATSFVGEQGMVYLDIEYSGDPTSLLASGDKCRKYRVGSILAKGGMGTVFTANDLNCRRKVAMKVLSDGKLATKRQVLRFIVEAQVTAQLDHPGIIPLYELSIDSSDRIFYTMRLVKGPNLVELLDKLFAGNDDFTQRYPFVRLLNIFVKVCEAVAFAHSKGVIHRDLKPDNIMTGDFGEVLVTDWGLAKIVSVDGGLEGIEAVWIDEDEFEGSDTDSIIDSIRADADVPGALKTPSGQVLGSPAFMPPEQALGKESEIDNRSDVYALGGLLYYMLTLRPSITGTNMRQVVRNIVDGKITPPASFNSSQIFPHCPGQRIPEPLSAIAMKALMTDPKCRYQSVPELQDDIERYLGGFATSAEDASVFSVIKLLFKRHLRVALLSISMLLVVVSVICVFMSTMIKATNTAEVHLKKYLFEQTERKVMSRKLLTGALESLGRSNPGTVPLKYRYAITSDRFMLNLSNNKHLITIDALKGIPLTELHLNRTAITDLSALTDMPLAILSLKDTRVSDLGRIAKAPITNLNISNTSIVDLAPLLDTTLTSLSIAGAPIRQIEVLNALKVSRLIVDSDQLREIPELSELGLMHLGIVNAKPEDLTLVSKLDLLSLELQGLEIKDLSPISRMKLRKLTLNSTAVRSIVGLEELPLTTLIIINGVIDDLTGLTALGLEELMLDRCALIEDAGPLGGCRELRKLLIPDHIKDIRFIAELPHLKVLANSLGDYENDQSVEQFKLQQHHNTK